MARGTRGGAERAEARNAPDKKRKVFAAAVFALDQISAKMNKSSCLTPFSSATLEVRARNIGAMKGKAMRLFPRVVTLTILTLASIAACARTTTTNYTVTESSCGKASLLRCAVNYEHDGVSSVFGIYDDLGLAPTQWVSFYPLPLQLGVISSQTVRYAQFCAYNPIFNKTYCSNLVTYVSANFNGLDNTGSPYSGKTTLSITYAYVYGGGISRGNPWGWVQYVTGGTLQLTTTD
jgi:hypothetical protein